MIQTFDSFEENITSAKNETELVKAFNTWKTDFTKGEDVEKIGRRELLAQIKNKTGKNLEDIEDLLTLLLNQSSKETSNNGEKEIYLWFKANWSLAGEMIEFAKTLIVADYTKIKETKLEISKGAKKFKQA